MDMSIEEHLQHQQWLINNGFINDLHKDNLYMYGAILSIYVTAVELDLTLENKTVSYKLYCKPKLIRALSKYQKASSSDSLWNLWRRKRLLKRFGTLNFNQILNSFVKDYCGQQWRAECIFLRESDYVDASSEPKSLPGS